MKIIVALLCCISIVITNGIAMQGDNEKPASEMNNSKKQKQPEPIQTQENFSSFLTTCIPFHVPVFNGLFCFQLEKLTCIPKENPSTYVLEYQLFERNQDGTTYTSKNFMTLTLKNLHAPYINITVNSNNQDQNAAHRLENHTWNATAAQRDNNFFDIITKELNKEFYILRCISFTQPDNTLACCNPKGCPHNNSSHLNNQTLILRTSLVLLKCGHYFHQKCLPVNFRETVDGCPVCKTLIETTDDFFTCDTTLPKITITGL